MKIKPKTIKQTFYSLLVDSFMGVLFLALFGFALWAVWIYFFRGPIAIETRGFVSRTIRTEAVQPADMEKYKINHFHNLDEIVVAGIQSGSLCVDCHGDYPHAKDKKTRAFFNAHAWFMACETCHIKPEEDETFDYQWLTFGSGEPMVSLDGQAGVYGGMIVPLQTINGQVARLDQLSEEEQTYAQAYVDKYEHMEDKEQKKMAMKRIHKSLDKKALSCEGCHSSDGVLNFSSLLYSAERSRHLESLDMASMVTTYKKFHLPSILEK